MSQPRTVHYDRVKAAQEFDAEHRPPLSNWTRVPDEQVSRLLMGADLYMAKIGMTITDAELVDAPGTGDQG